MLGVRVWGVAIACWRLYTRNPRPNTTEHRRPETLHPGSDDIAESDVAPPSCWWRILYFLPRFSTLMM